MQYQYIGYRIRGFYRVARLGNLADMNPPVQHRLNILDFRDRHGAAATRDAFGVSRRTLYRWKAALRDAGGDPASLAPRQRAPRRRRRRNWPGEVIAQIRHLRTAHPNLGKAKVRALLSPWCDCRQLPCPSVSTIGRIIADDPDRMRHTPAHLTPNGRPKPFKRKHKPRKPKGQSYPPLQVFACDTITRVRDGIRRYLFTFIDPNSRFAIALAVPTASSQQATIALQGLCQLLPAPPRFILSDNGAEFHGRFEQTLQQRAITHWWTYPKCPKMNAHAERFNRSIQESFVDFHEHLLFTDLAAFNRKLADWLVFYNTQLPHHSLGLQSPVQSLLHQQRECQMGWTHTRA